MTAKSLLIVSKSVDLAFAQVVRSLASWLLDSFPNLKLTLDARLKGVLGGLLSSQTRVAYWDPGFCAACYGSIDLIVTLGGDGTVLYTSWLFQKCTVPPVLPFYLGSLGFLTDFDIADIKDVLTSALTPPDSPSEDNFTTTKKLKTLTQCSRMRLSVTIYRHRPRQRSLLVTRRELARTRSNTWTSLDAPLADGIGNTIGGTTENINTCTIQEEQLTKNTLASPHSPKTSSPLHGSFDLGRPPKMTPQESTASSKSSDSPLGRGGAQLDDLALLRSAGGSLSKILGGESGRKVPKESGSNSHLESPFPGAAGSAIPVETFHVLNEVVVDRGPSAYMSQLELFVGGKHLTSVQADGLVLSTPTGSTAYSLSAGGSLVHPQVPSILVTPICPHSLSFRPMILPNTVDVRVQVPLDSRYSVWASFDGKHRIELSQGDSVVVSQSPYPMLTLSSSNLSNDWFESVSSCLHWNTRARQKPLEASEAETIQLLKTIKTLFGGDSLERVSSKGDREGDSDGVVV